MKIAHLSDIHIRIRERHDEYREVFSRLYVELKNQNPDRILLNGDIVHSKITLSPELVSLTIDFFNNLRKIAPVDLIVGNHDMNVSNMDRMDSLTPLVNAVNNIIEINPNTNLQYPDINYYKDTGFYEVFDGKFVYGVYSLLDGKDIHLTNKMKEKGKIYIALYHGPVSGCKLDNDYVINDSSTSLSTFENFDFVMLGDIHKRQFINDSKTAAYCGSLIQQNYGEDIEKGFLMWDIRSPDDFDCEFIRVYNDHAYATIYANADNIPDLDLPPKTNIRVIWEAKSKDISKLESIRLNNLIKDKYKPISIQLSFKPTDSFVFEKVSDYSNISNRNVQRELLREWLLKLEHSVDIDKILEIDDIVTSSVTNSEFEDFSNENWHLKKLYIDNFMSYDNEVEIDFNNMRGIIGLFGNNAVGKSVIIDSILYALFNKTTREVKNEELINRHTNRETCTVKLQIEIGGVDYEIKRWTTKQYKKGSGDFINSRTDVTLKRKCGDGDWENISETQRNDTEKVIRNAIGNYDDFMITTLSTQGGTSEFLKLKKSPRADIMLRFLGLDIFSKKYDHSKNVLKQISNDIENYEKLINKNIISEKINRQNDINKELQNINIEVSNLSTEISNIREEIFKYQNMINTTVKIDKDFEEIQNEISNLKLDIDSLIDLANSKKNESEDLNFSIEELKKDFILDENEIKKLEAIRSRADELNKMIKENSSKIVSNENILKIYARDLKNGNGCPVSDDVRHKTCSFLCSYSEKKDKYDQLLNDVSIIKSANDCMSGELSTISYVYKKLNDQNMLNNGIISAYDKINKLNDDVLNILDRIEAKNVSLKLLNSQLKISKNNIEVIKNNRDYRSKISLLTDDLNSKIKILDSKNEKREDLSVELGIIRKEIDDSNLVLEKISIEEKKYNLMNTYCDAMHRTGLPIDILKKYIPKINYEINKILNSIVNFEVFLQVEDGETDIDLLMKYNWENGQSSPAIMGCGMEKMLMNMAIRCAILSVSNLNVSSSWYIDEGFGTLSAENRILMKKFFETVHDKFRNIIIISHLDELKDIVDYPIIIENVNGISKLNFQT